MRRLFVLAVVLAVVGVTAGLASAAPAPKVDVCHYDAYAGTYHLINISENAFEQHLAHGDYSPGESVPGMDHYVFGPDCVPEYEAWVMVDGEFVGTGSYPGLATTIELWQTGPSTYSGTGTYYYPVSGGEYQFTISDFCIGSGIVTVRGDGTSNGVAGFPLVGHGILTIKDGSPMKARAGFKATAAELDSIFAAQCGGSPVLPASGNGYLTIVP